MNIPSVTKDFWTVIGDRMLIETELKWNAVTVQTIQYRIEYIHMEFESYNLFH
jgi:hypothetical protein